jgi:hypothetical protein
MSNIFHRGRWIGVTNAARYKRDETWMLVFVNTDKFDEGFRRNPAYIGPNICRDWLRDLDRFEASIVYVDDDGAVCFENGRHRYAILRDAGRKKIPVSMDAQSLVNAERYGYTLKRPLSRN